ncbi:phosphoribosyltransferase family protein [Tahibacter amnicola]|uniref:Phosphoribosyltransferase family protein n=1 Tax=Tahibacter amnicola TaxID=2976241 RepID=A0ABY6B896_9GAMM|nr:phosphoribosyltransferase family protein [Tahibacter amnicola]UXI66308.1 phosphoribosyltransferase family protein [Tahibacter amnicola]
MPLHSRHAFADRAEAARLLASALGAFQGRHPLVLAIPRGGVPIGRIVADHLGGDLDVVLVRKLGAPHNPEFAIGAVDEHGGVQLNEDTGVALASPEYLAREIEQQMTVIRARRREYRPGVPPLSLAGRCVIVVDDGLATGATMAAALRMARKQKPSRLVCAVPVAAPDSLAAIARLADEVVCLRSPDEFYAVGQFYDDFSAVDDATVMGILAQSAVTSDDPDHDNVSRSIAVEVDGVTLQGDLDIPAHAIGLVIFAHGSGSGRHSPRNRFVSALLNREGLATLLLDLLTEAEDKRRSARFDIATLGRRLGAAMTWAGHDGEVAHLPIGLFGASTGAAAALVLAAERPGRVAAVVSRGGRVDLAGSLALARVVAPTLLIAGSADTEVLALNRAALTYLAGPQDLTIVPGAGHLFEEPGALDRVAHLAAAWFGRWLAETSVDDDVTPRRVRRSPGRLSVRH